MATPNNMENASVGRAAVKDDSVENGLSSELSEQKGSKTINDESGENSSKESAIKGDAGGGDGLSPADSAGEATKGESGNLGNVVKGANMTSVASKSGILAKMMNFAQMGLATGANALTSLAGGATGIMSAAWGAIQSAGTAIAGFVAGVGSTVAGVLGIGASTATALTSFVGVAAVTALVVSGAVVVNNMNMGTRDGTLIDCSEDVRKAQAAEAVVDENAQTLANAQKLWSVMKTYGLSDDQIAGILGNYSVESGIDPTTIEGIYAEPHNINGSRHQSALEDLDAYTRGPLSASYAKKGKDYTQNAGYMASDGKKYPGIGLAQWTGGGAMNLLNFADSIDKDWWDLDYQIAYMLAKCAPTGAFGSNFWEEMKEQTGDSETMTVWYAKHFEGNTKMAISERCEAATSWKSQMSGWTQDIDYGNSIITMAEQLGAAATDKATSRALDKCIKSMNYDNSTLAKAVVSYAYETHDEGKGNDGTPLYQRLHKAIAPGDTYFQSCDRGVAIGVRWSGTDDTFPFGATSTQLTYLQTSEKWEEVGASSSLKMEDLLPGDIFCLSGHIFIYVGNDAVKEKYPDSNGDSVSASSNERSPGVGLDSTDIIVNRGGQDWIGRGEYYVFRCVKPDNSTTYKDAGAGGN